MAFINCPESGKENVSQQAIACPNCGYGIICSFLCSCWKGCSLCWQQMDWWSSV